MKTRNLLLALLTMAVTMAADAQDNVLKAFEEIEKSTSVHPSSSTSEERDSTGRVISSTYYKGFKTGSTRNGLSEILRKAFEKDKGNAKTAFINITPDETRYRYQIVQKGGRTISIGGREGSSYLILTFPDKEHQGFRHAYAAEWWDAGDQHDPNIQEGYIVIAYGETPATSHWGFPSFKMDGTLGVDTTRFHMFSGEDWADKAGRYKEIYEKYKSLPMPDMSQLNTFKGTPFHWDSRSGQWKALPEDGTSSALPGTGDKDEWMTDAMGHIENLNNKDWHRLFGIITQKMSQGDYSEEDLVVAAGIVLTLCKNAVDLDSDEKEVCVSRLKTIAKKFSDPYIRDMLILSAKKLKEP